MKNIGFSLLIETERLAFRPIGQIDKYTVCKEFTAQVTRYMPFTPTGNLEEISQFISTAMNNLVDLREIIFCILEKKTDEFLGCAGLHHINAGFIELGIWLKIGSHRKGYGLEAIQRLVRFIDENFAVEYISYPVDVMNFASRRIPELLGFRIIKSYNKHKSATQTLHILEYRKYMNDAKTDIPEANAALIDEYRKAVNELITFIAKIDQDQLDGIIIRNRPDTGCESVKSILNHVISCMYSYAGYVAHSLHISSIRPPQSNFNSVQEFISGINQAFAYTEQIFFNHPQMILEECEPTRKILTSWGQQYDIEQMLEHAIVHVLRHRRQIVRALNGLLTD